MSNKTNALIVINKTNKQINLSLSKKKISKKMLVELMKSKKVDIDLTKLYPK
ncbi:hypothetical protein LCGC14_0509490 [marine sediment metagenome]|uniref:Uncharacterized protein n=1 Tax=marine sediment metagenome TaxID=412755 RepID=A0A0F9VA18_9ZZZZ